ncbi:MAG: hypothetical protein ACI376_00925 [Candidatus Bruticola sp.]
MNFPRFVEKNVSYESRFVEGGSDFEESRAEFVCVCAQEADCPNAEKGFFCLPAHEWYTICGLAERGSLVNRRFVDWLATQQLSEVEMKQIEESLAWKSSWERVYDMSLCAFQSFESADVCQDWQEEILERADRLYSKFMEEQSCISLEAARFSLLVGYQYLEPDKESPKAEEVIAKYWAKGADCSKLPCSVAALIRAGFQVYFCRSVVLSWAEAGADTEFTSFYSVAPPPLYGEEQRTFAVKRSKVNQPGVPWRPSGQIAGLKLLV